MVDKKEAPVSSETRNQFSACACSLFRVLDESRVSEKNPDDYDEYTTGCAGGKTKSRFLPGHDAKLKSLLIKSGIHDWSVRKHLGGGDDQIASAEVFAKDYGFDTQVLAGIVRGKQKLADKAKPKKATAPATTTAAPALAAVVADEEAKHQKKQREKIRQQQAHAEWADDAQLGAQSAREERERGLVKAKVGRWEYLGLINEKSGAFHYTSNSGDKKVAKSGRFTLVGDSK